MKKQTQFLIAAGILALASSCNTSTGGDPAADAAKIDSMANARLEELKLELMARNDSTIMALARERADSILVAMGNKPTPKPAAPKKVISRDKGTATTDVSDKAGDNTPRETIGNGKPKMGNQDNNTIGNGKPKMGNQDNNTIGNGKPKMGNN